MALKLKKLNQTHVTEIEKCGLRILIVSIKLNTLIQEQYSHETGICCNPLIHSFTGDKKALTDP
jgi:hypothetical protein